MHGKNLGGRPRGAHSQTIDTGVLVRVVRDMGLPEDALHDLLPGDGRKRREKADYAEGRLVGRSRQDRKHDRQQQRARLKQANFIEDVCATADLMLARGVVTPRDRARARRLAQSLGATADLIRGWIDSWKGNSVEYSDWITPAGVPYADDIQPAISVGWRTIQAVNQRRMRLLAILASPIEVERRLVRTAGVVTAPKGDYLTLARGTHPRHPDRLMPCERDELAAAWIPRGAVSAECVEEFAARASANRTVAEPAFCWEDGYSEDVDLEVAELFDDDVHAWSETVKSAFAIELNADEA